jgi:hypothetical protein
MTGPVDFVRQEEAFSIYRDMGPTRSYARLREAFAPKYGDYTERTFSNWAKAHH